jgi:hypothetical protein
MNFQNVITNVIQYRKKDNISGQDTSRPNKYFGHEQAYDSVRITLDYQLI